MNYRNYQNLIDGFSNIENGALAAIPAFITSEGGVAHRPSDSKYAFKSTLRTSEALRKLSPGTSFDNSIREKIKEFSAKLPPPRTDKSQNFLDRLKWLLYWESNRDISQFLEEYNTVIKSVQERHYFRTLSTRIAEEEDCDHTIFLHSLFFVLKKRELIEVGPQEEMFLQKAEVIQRCVEEVYKQYAFYSASEFEYFDLAQLVFAMIPALNNLPKRLAESALLASANFFSERRSQFFPPYRNEGRDHQLRPIWQEVLATICDASTLLLERHKLSSGIFSKVIPALQVGLEKSDGSFIKNRNISGWARQENPGNPELWPTLATLEMSRACVRLLRIELLLSLKNKYGFRLSKPAKPSRDLRCFESLPFGILDTVRHKFLDNNRRDWSSAVLFGPPGTGKTTFVKAMAQELDWWFVEITPADLALEGPDGIVARARDLLSNLACVEQAVILFDEFDPFILSRTGDNKEGTWSALVTNCMLPLLADLRESQRSIFILATNFVDRLDDAATREGRFDAILPIWLPAKAERTSIISQFSSVDQDQQVYSAYAETSKWASWGELKYRSLSGGPWNGFAASPDADNYEGQLKKSRPKVNPKDFD